MQADPKRTRRLLATARGQIDGVIKMIEEDRYCIDISHQLMATEAILRKVNRMVLHAHLEHCVMDAMDHQDPEERKVKLEEVAEIIDRLSKG